MSFSNGVKTVVPPTTDRQKVKDWLSGLKPKGGTAMGDALMTALEDLQAASATPVTATPVAGGGATPVPTPTPTPSTTSGGQPTNVVVLLSDGANTLGQTDPLDAATAAAEQSVPIYTIALGTADGVAQVQTLDGPCAVEVRVRQTRQPCRRYRIRRARSRSRHQRRATSNPCTTTSGRALDTRTSRKRLRTSSAGLGAVLLVAGASLR